jgi:membrane protein YdbS with pleckstrin-like domain
MVANVFLIVTVTVIAMIIDTDVFQARCWRYDIDICEWRNELDSNTT